MPQRWRDEWQPAHTSEITAGWVTAVFAGALMEIIAWHQPAEAAVCHIPAAVVCPGCAERLSIRVTPGGVCRISFTSPASSEAAAAGKFIDIDVETEPLRPARRRGSAPHLSDAKPAIPPRPSAGCFTFNSRRFCE